MATTNGDAPRPTGAAMDMLLTDAGVSGAGRWLPGLAGVKATARLALRPDRLVRRSAGVAAETARICASAPAASSRSGRRQGNT